jgi:hypothetical protein
MQLIFTPMILRLMDKRRRPDRRDLTGRPSVGPGRP